MSECPRCGTDPVPRARYCHQCGERLDAGALDLKEEQIAPEAGDRWRFWAVVVLALLLFGGSMWLTSSWFGTPTPPPARKAAIAERPKQIFYAIRQTRLRSTKTTEAENVLRPVARGEEVRGMMEMGQDGATRWLNTGEKGPYIAVMNLAERAPPPLDLVLNDVLTAESPIILFAAPGDDESSASVATVAKGESLQLTGVIGNWFEVTPRQGGVAYFRPADGKAKKLMAKALGTIDKAARQNGN